MSKTYSLNILICLWIFCFLPVDLLGQSDQDSYKDLHALPQDLQVIHPQFRKWSTPSVGMEPLNNPPVFLWPVSSGEGITYDFRLSQDSNFQSIAYSGNEIPYAIYCPYKRLETGNWYWQYRVNEKQWSDTHAFTISDSTSTWDLPSKQKLKANIPAGHPRVLIQDSDLNTFRSEVRHTEDAQYVIKKADKNLTRSFPSEELNISGSGENNEDRLKKLRKDASKELGNTALDVIGSLARAFVITGEKKYADRAVDWALQVAKWDPEGVSSLNDFGDSRCMLSMALAYDTFYDRFSGPEKQQLLNAIEARASRFYNDWINLIEAKVLSNHVWQHVYHYFFQTALATYGHIPESERWIDYLYELFIARAPALGRDDGAWVNGNSYFKMNMAVLLDVPLVLKDLTGFDFFRHKKWYQNNPYYLWYSLPPHSSSDGFGDNSKGFFHPNKEYIAYADALAKITGNHCAGYYAGAAREGTNIEISDDNSLRWLRLKYLRGLQEAESSVPPELSRSKIFRDAGLVYMNSDLLNTSGNLMLAMRSSPFGSYGHMLADQNAFNITYGGKPLFFHSGHKISMNDPHRREWYKHTKSHNGILIDGEGQPYSTEAFGWIPRFINGKTMGYAMGNAARAYNSVDHGGKTDYGVKRFNRHIVMLYPDIIIIYDDLESDHPAEWSWVIHSPDKISLDKDQNQFLCSSGKTSSKVNVYASTGLTWNLSNKYEVPAENWRGKQNKEGEFVEYRDNDRHLQGQSEKTENMRFLSVIQVRPGKVLLPVETNKSGSIECGDWTITAELDPQKSGSLEIYKNDGTVAFSSGGEELRLGDEIYKGKEEGSAKLVEEVGGKVVVRESTDQMPYDMKVALKQLNK